MYHNVYCQDGLEDIILNSNFFCEDPQENLLHGVNIRNN